MSGAGRSTISNVSERMEEAGALLESALEVAFLAAAVVVVTCVAALVAAGTFAVIHPGNDFGFGGSGGSGRGGDIIVPPAQRF
jgi:hypothetical protein